MHDADWDFPCAPCWLPSYQPSKGRTLPPTGRIWNQDDFEAQRTIDALRIGLRAAQREAAKLRFEVEHLRAKKPITVQDDPPTVPDYE